MLVRVAVSDPFPVFRQGIMAILGDIGLQPEAPSDLRVWAQDEECRIVLLTLRNAADWTLLSELCQRAGGGLVVVAVLDDAGVADYVRAITAGAAGPLPRDATASAVRAAFEAAMDGKTLLPIDVLHALAQRPQHVEPSEPSVVEIGWLRDLAQGVSVARLADRAGYSERMMFRLLRDVYAKVGAASRTEALIRARDRGWV
jgi:DNA-binding NarL/FixJ family response regulator